MSTALGVVRGFGRRRRGRWPALAAFLGAACATAAAGSVASIDAGEFYASLPRPAWAPPSWLFGPVWTILYGTIGVAGWLAWLRRRVRDEPVAFGLFAAQLLLNAGWTWIFFGGQALGLAFAELVVLWLAILVTVVAFWRIRPAAGALLLPYLGWVTFAGALNLSIWLAA